MLSTVLHMEWPAAIVLVAIVVGVGVNVLVRQIRGENDQERARRLNDLELSLRAHVARLAKPQNTFSDEG